MLEARYSAMLVIIRCQCITIPSVPKFGTQGRRGHDAYPTWIQGSPGCHVRSPIDIVSAPLISCHRVDGRGCCRRAKRHEQIEIDAPILRIMSRIRRASLRFEVQPGVARAKTRCRAPNTDPYRAWIWVSASGQAWGCCGSEVEAGVESEVSIIISAPPVLRRTYQQRSTYCIPYRMDTAIYTR